MKKCWDIDPKKRPTFLEIASEVDHIMEVSAGYLQLSSIPMKEGELMGERDNTQSPELDLLSSSVTSVSQLIKGVKTDAGITIQLDQYFEETNV